ncbi:amidohydrolase family protein [Phytohabitans sp. ZYX-F-186]|uniref:Amidohydrolase family protein n=1 Tax=Phytohabitans maris TaxID=3071409 RepID=A0ABU0ZBK6_9ACTN|nr:amidohydrolase family protein [Phytohabitans sp. ZYX-F-186]MDQ7903741.1 amidohydrolase family protein [Phytohabitans sp. ZYX-F-186]
MAFPTDIGVIDTLIGLPTEEVPAGDDDVHEQISYMFKKFPQVRRHEGSVDDLLRTMDAYGIEKGLVPVLPGDEMAARAIVAHPDRLLGCLDVDPHRGMDAVRDLQRAYETIGVVGAQFMPALLAPPVPIDDRRAYPLYAKCVELDIPIFVNGGVPGPRLPYASQHPGLVDEVCYFFPELKFVFRHCCEPWVDLTVKLLLKYPNLYYSTTGFAPKYYPPAIIEYANTRGADKVIYGGYYPYGLELERIFAELRNLPLKDEVWPKFLRENAARVLGVGR